MVDLDRHRVAWTGFIGEPGVSTFYVAGGTAANAALQTFFTSICAYLPTDVVLQVEPSGDTIDSATGALTGAWSDTTEAALAGTDSYSYSAVSGILVRWHSATFLSGRRLRGHTFLVPVSSHGYDTTGQVDSGHVLGTTTAAQAMITTLGGALLIWQRPRVARGAYTDRRGVVHPAITARGGGYGPVTTGTCSPKVTELRSRRD